VLALGGSDGKQYSITNDELRILTQQKIICADPALIAAASAVRFRFNPCIGGATTQVAKCACFETSSDKAMVEKLQSAYSGNYVPKETEDALAEMKTLISTCSAKNPAANPAEQPLAPAPKASDGFATSPSFLLIVAAALSMASFTTRSPLE
jgi:hypothetical protein